MTEVFFYHLERSAPEEVLPSLLEKTLARGWRALVKLGSREELDAVDELLWSYRDDSFLPHGESGPDHPVLLGLTDTAENGAEAAFLMPGVTMPPQAMRGFSRCVLMFRPGGADGARAQWRILREEGFDVTYWRQEPDGRWAKAGE
mgnify:CR=1 FL=1